MADVRGFVQPSRLNRSSNDQHFLFYLICSYLAVVDDREKNTKDIQSMCLLGETSGGNWKNWKIL